MNIKIKQKDNNSFLILEGTQIVYDLLSYTKEYWVNVGNKKQKKEYVASFVLGKQNKFFYSGFIKKIETYCNVNNIKLDVIKKNEVKITGQPKLKNITIRKYQLDAIKAALSKNGVIKAATGSGKSIILAGILSCFNNHKVLILAPKIDLVNQIYDTLSNIGFDSLCKVGDGKKEINADIVISTIQTFVKLDLVELSDRFDIVICDEIHLATGKNATIEKILSSCLAERRWGFTATLPNELENRLLIEGLIGPVIYDLGVSEGIEMDILSKPKIKFISVPEKKEVSYIKNYKEMYRIGIVENSIRNRLIAKETQALVNNNLSVLIFCTELKHMDLIGYELNELKIKYEIVKGETSPEERNKIKKHLSKKEIMVVISSSVWTTGLDIPTLDAGILASGGVSETTLMQKIGRCLRKSEGKDCAIIIDFLDNGRWISDHSVTRIKKYVSLGWM